MHLKLAFLIFTLLCGARLFANSEVYSYQDFGPQSAVYELIGYEWYQWESNGDSNPKTNFNIKVVVYWNESLDKIKEQYPVDPKKKQDFRYLKKADAIKHLKKLISDFEEIPLSADKLKATLIKLETKEPNHAVEPTRALPGTRGSP